MIALILYIGLILFCLYLTTTWDWEALGMVGTLVFSVMLFIHCLIWGLSSYDYEQFKAEGETLQRTIEIARDSSDSLENFQLTQNIIEWNVALARSKVSNKTWYFGIYTDDRIEDLEPIK